MLNLFDYLSEKDNKIIENYINLYGVEEGYIGNEEYLKYWNDCNKKLFHLLGGKLIHKVDFTYNKPESVLLSEMYKLMSESEFKKVIADIKLNNPDSSDFEHVYDTIFYSLMTTQGLVNNIYDSKCEIILNWNPNKKNVKISKGIKLMKAILKVLQYAELDKEPEIVKSFEKFRIAHSLILNDKIIKGKLCLSIHPMDFMTMSDNDSDWSSCMSWVRDGCYHVGTVEMMNSNNVICAYLESSKPYIFADECEGEEEFYSWNNKKWRQLFYATKEIIVSGKPYPYAADEITKYAISVLRDLAKENWGREYEYGIEQYQDMKNIHKLEDIENISYWIRHNNTKKHNIVFHTQGMYNDMFNDHNTKYWCVRNKVKKNVLISYSGKCPCLKCGNKVIEERDYDDDGYNGRYDRTGSAICSNCIEYCESCEEDSGGKYKIHLVKGMDGYEHKICTNCIRNNILQKCSFCGKTVLIRNGNRDIDGSRNYYFIANDEVRKQKYASDLEYFSEKLHCCNDCFKSAEVQDLFEKKTLQRSYWSSSNSTVDLYVSKKNYDSSELKKIKPIKITYNEYINRTY